MNKINEYKPHPNEVFLTRMSAQQLELFQFEVEIYENPAPYLNALMEQLTRLGIAR